MNSPGQYGEDYRSYRDQDSRRKNLFYLELILLHLGNPLGASLLDVGCGTGTFLRFARAHEPSWDLNGTEVSAFARSRARALVPEARIIQASATDTPAGLGNHDVVTAWDVLEHVADRDKAAGAVLSLLTPGGVFAFAVPVYDGLTGPIVRTLDRDPTHIHKYGRRDWLDWAARHFTVEAWIGVFRLMLPWGFYPHFSTNRLRTQSPAIAVVCRRQP